MRSPLITLCILAAGLCMAAPASIAQTQVLATVDGKAITEADLRLAEREVGTELDLAPEERRRVLVEVVIQRQVLAAAAEQAKLQAGKDFDERLAHARRGVLQQLLIEKHAKETATEADARRIYDGQAALMLPEEEVRARQIVVANEDKARQLRTAILKGADFATLAKTQSTDPPSAQQSGDLGWRTKTELPDKLAAAVFALSRKGDLSAPIQTASGWHLVRLEERRMRPVPEFAELKDHIMRILGREKARELATSLREKAKVVYLEADLQPAAAARAPASGTTAAGGAPRTASSSAATGQAAGAAGKVEASATAKAASAAGNPAPPPPPRPASATAAATFTAAAKASLWQHDGARMKLLSEGERVMLQFESPPVRPDSSGIGPGAVLFQGTRKGKTYAGEATAFSPRCGSRAFPVTGEASADYLSITLRGTAPVLDANCAVSGTRAEALRFDYAGAASR